MSVVLKQATATCPTCGHQAHQIDTIKERAVEVVTKAIEEHMAEQHDAEPETTTNREDQK